jgi:iron complex outermembrane receptor protein
MNIPLVRKLDIDISGRYDNISLVGATSNPKFAATWELTDWLKARGNYSTSFVAPSLDSVGDPAQNYNLGNSSVVTYSSGGAFNIKLNPNGTATNFPGAGMVAGVLPGCAVGATSCILGSSSTPGIQHFPGCGPTCQPQKGDTWSAGLDFVPDFLPGLISQVTYWNTKYKGGITSPLAQAEVSSPGLIPFFTLCPTGCTSAQIASKVGTEPVGGALPPISYFIYDFGQHNVVYINAAGIDFNAEYQIETDYGMFKIGDSLTEFTEFDYHAGAGSPPGSILNTAGFTTTFPSIQTRMRANFGWSNDIMSADVFVNFTGSYHDWSGDTALTFDANNNPNGGGRVVKSNTTVDLHFAYNFPSGMFGGDQIWFDTKNLFDTDPPFVNNNLAGGIGYDGFVSSPLGRVTSVGLDVKW